MNHPDTQTQRRQEEMEREKRLAGLLPLSLFALCLFSSLCLGVWVVPSSFAPAPPSDRPKYARDVAPLIGKYCLRCHSPPRPKGGMALDRDRDDAAVLKNLAAWEKVGDTLRAGEMPPAGAKKPTAADME